MGANVEIPAEELARETLRLFGVAAGSAPSDAIERHRASRAMDKARRGVAYTGVRLTLSTNGGNETCFLYSLSAQFMDGTEWNVSNRESWYCDWQLAVALATRPWPYKGTIPEMIRRGWKW